MSRENFFLGDNLRFCRKQRNLSEREVSRLLHVDITTISKYEHNTRTPDIYMMMRFADVYNVSLDQLVGRK
ncbi:helix-turn-helix domain-containing protein [Companilactobacillus nuruki]|uniref:Transcriptional regulator n=1 Tax=Companilactobacillus nuruki TaxID=1993540 RepID=A0A2N7ATK7_9LACO|nr:helix-turn-helix transcriptional regulator [Companilactobacillus nuruki]PMD69510.1 transcriptional regulator [Companilactobacillus nuruki]